MVVNENEWKHLLDFQKASCNTFEILSVALSFYCSIKSIIQPVLAFIYFLKLFLFLQAPFLQLNQF